MLIPTAVLVGSLRKAAADQDIEIAQLHLGCRERFPSAFHGAPLVEDLVGEEGVADEERITGRADGTTQHLIGVSILEEALPRLIVKRQYAVGGHYAGEALQHRCGHL